MHSFSVLSFGVLSFKSKVVFYSHKEMSHMGYYKSHESYKSLCSSYLGLHTDLGDEYLQDSCPSEMLVSSNSSFFIKCRVVWL